MGGLQISWEVPGILRRARDGAVGFKSCALNVPISGRYRTGAHDPAVRKRPE